MSGHDDDPPSVDFDDFYDAHRDQIGRALAFVLGDHELGREAVDEAMLEACRKWDEVRRMENPAGWVFVVGKRWGLSWRRSRRRERRREESVMSGGAEYSDGPTREYVDLMAALRQLNEKHRTVVVCRFHLGLSVEETSGVLGIEIGTVKSRLSRALDQLRVLLADGK